MESLALILPCEPAPAAFERENLPVFSRCLDEAEKIVAGQIQILSAGTAHFQDPDFWKRHPLSHVPLPGGIHPYNMERHPCGDLFLAAWVTTFSCLPLLAQAYRMSGRQEFLDCTCKLIDSWLEQHAPASSLCWEDGLVVGLRAVAILYTLGLLGRAPLSLETRRRMRRVILASGPVLQEALRKPSFNHRIMTAFGLFCCGLAARKTSWTKSAAFVLESDSVRQFFEDGVHGERSPGYMRFVLEIYLHFRALGQAHGHTFSPDFDRRLLRGCEALFHLAGPQAALPAFGDDSDLSLFAETRTAAAGLAVAAVLFRRADFKACAGEFPLPAFWLLGDEGYRRFQALSEKTPELSSFALPHAGYYGMRSGSTTLQITCGAELTPRNGHSHADVLAFELQVAGDRVLVDPGSYAYYPSRKWRDYFRGTLAHNTAAIDGEDQAVPLAEDHFGWAKFPHVRVHAWRTSATADFFDAEHDGYARLEEPVVHRRRVLFVRPGCWLIVDDFVGAGAHLCELHFQFAPGQVCLCAPGKTVAFRPWGRLEVWQLAEGCEADLVSGREEPIRGWISRGYGHREPAPSLRIIKKGALPLRFYTVLLPVRGEAGIPVQRDGEMIQVGSNRIHVPHGFGEIHLEKNQGEKHP